MSKKGSPSIFNVLQQGMLRNIFKETVCMRLYKFLIFCLRFCFLKTYPPIIFFTTIRIFQDRRCFSTMLHFSLLFLLKHPWIFSRNRRFCEHRGLLKVSTLCDLPETLFEKNQELFRYFVFLRGFRLSRMLCVYLS